MGKHTITSTSMNYTGIGIELVGIRQYSGVNCQERVILVTASKIDDA